MAQDQLGGIEPLKECGLHLGAVRRMFPMIGLAMTVLSKRHDGGKNKSGDGQGCDRVKWFPHSANLVISEVFDPKSRLRGWNWPS